MISTAPSLLAAQQAHLAGDAAVAEHAYRSHLDAHPDDAAGRHWLGFLLQQQGRSEEAWPLLQQAVVMAPGHAEWWFNLGIVLARLGRHGEALPAFTAAVELDGGQYFYWTNLGACQLQLADAAAAEWSWRQTSQRWPQRADAYYLLAELCSAQARHEEARLYNYRGMVCEGSPTHSEMALAQAWCELGERERAQALLQGWLAREPAHPVARHLLAACSQQAVPVRCDDAYVSHTFDSFAPHFDSKLAALAYTLPAMLHALAQEQGWPQRAWRVLDLGCGTGLAGQVLARHAGFLAGVDLSAGMLAQARAKDCYHALQQAEIGAWLAQGDDSYDLVCCLDTFIYLGEVTALLGDVRRRLHQGGRFVFSIETAPAGTERYRLNASGRYSHAATWLQQLLTSAGFTQQQWREVVLRQEAGAPLLGQLCCAWG